MKFKALGVPLKILGYIVIKVFVDFIGVSNIKRNTYKTLRKFGYYSPTLEYIIGFEAGTAKETDSWLFQFGAVTKMDCEGMTRGLKGYYRAEAYRTRNTTREEK